jgi:hypothetical protein
MCAYTPSLVAWTIRLLVLMGAIPGDAWKVLRREFPEYCPARTGHRAAVPLTNRFSPLAFR